MNSRSASQLLQSRTSQGIVRHQSSEERGENNLDVHQRPTFNQPVAAIDLRRDRWCRMPRVVLALVCLSVGAIISTTVLGIKYTNLRKKSPHEPIITTPLLSDALPIVDAKLGVAAGFLGSFFTFPSHKQIETKVVYTTGAREFCVRTEDSSWSNKVQCVEGTNPRPDTPLVMLDWVGGPSIIYITADNLISSINNAPTNNTWRLSNLRSYKIRAHKESQLAAVAWLNGTSARIYYQDYNGQLREFGIDDYRDQLWREGSAGPLGPCKIGSGIGVCRWLGPAGEVEEVFCQSANRAIQGRKYRNTAWDLMPYSVQFTPSNVSTGTSISATTINQGNSTFVLLTYLSSSGSLVVQTRTTANLQEDEKFREFSPPTQIARGDGRVGAGLAAVSWFDQAKVCVVVEGNVLVLSSNGPGAANWSSATVPF
ncbi:MAG: hypothetical protein M1840_005120 [Geoglossum simile]|nr:MAG: hypothetical protein M1840_005120 [Geoglossum simile]